MLLLAHVTTIFMDHFFEQYLQKIIAPVFTIAHLKEERMTKGGKYIQSSLSSKYRERLFITTQQNIKQTYWYDVVNNVTNVEWTERIIKWDNDTIIFHRSIVASK